MQKLTVISLHAAISFQLVTLVWKILNQIALPLCKHFTILNKQPTNYIFVLTLHTLTYEFTDFQWLDGQQSSLMVVKVLSSADKNWKLFHCWDVYDADGSSQNAFSNALVW